MSKKEEIREGITLLMNECYSKKGSACKLHSVFQPQEFLNRLLPYLHSQGVVIKKEEELPVMTGCFRGFSDDEVAKISENQKAILRLVHDGYTLTEPLIGGK